MISSGQQNPGVIETYIEAYDQIVDFERRLLGLIAGLCAEEVTARH